MLSQGITSSADGVESVSKILTLFHEEKALFQIYLSFLADFKESGFSFQAKKFK